METLVVWVFLFGGSCHQKSKYYTMMFTTLCWRCFSCIYIYIFFFYRRNVTSPNFWLDFYKLWYSESALRLVGRIQFCFLSNKYLNPTEHRDKIGLKFLFEIISSLYESCFEKLIYPQLLQKFHAISSDYQNYECSWRGYISFEVEIYYYLLHRYLIHVSQEGVPYVNIMIINQSL